MKTFVLLILLCVSTVSFAQFKPQVGVNWSKLTNTHTGFTAKSDFGYMVGATYKSRGKVYLETGLFYQNIKSTVESEMLKVSSTLSTFRAPLFVGYALQEEDSKNNIRFFTGPSANLKLGVNSNVFYLNQDAYSNVTWGWNFGVGIDLSIVFIELSYELGMTDIYKVNEPFNSRAKNNMLIIAAGVRLF